MEDINKKLDSLNLNREIHPIPSLSNEDLKRDYPYIKFIRKNDVELVCKQPFGTITNIREIIFYSNFDHPHIPKIQYVESDTFCIPRYKNISIRPENIKKFLLQMLQTLDYIHSKGICHSDIKEYNILQDNNEDFYLIDFGTAQFYSFSSTQKEYISTPGLRIENLEYNNDVNVDIFSLAMTVIKLITGRPGYFINKYQEKEVEKSDEIIEILDELKPKIVNFMNRDGFDLLLLMLGLKDEKLISANIALNHPYFNIKYTKQITNFNDIKPFINTEWNLMSKKSYINNIKVLLEFTIELKYDYLTFLLFIQIYRKIINQIIFNSKTKAEIYIYSCLALAAIMNEDSKFRFFDIHQGTNFEYSIDIFKTCVIKIMHFLNFNIQLIPYNFYIENDEYSKVIFTYLISFDNEDLTLQQISDKCLNRTFNLNVRKWNFNSKLSILENTLNLAEDIQ